MCAQCCPADRFKSVVLAEGGKLKLFCSGNDFSLCQALLIYRQYYIWYHQRVVITTFHRRQPTLLHKIWLTMEDNI